MTGVLLITDDLRRTKPLATELNKISDCCHYDILADELRPNHPKMIVSDIKTMSSDVFHLFRTLMNKVRIDKSSYIYLYHGNSARSNTFANLLNATQVLDASLDVETIVKRVSESASQFSGKLNLAAQYSNSALELFQRIFIPGNLFEAEGIDGVSKIVLNAVEELGIREWIQAVRDFDDATHQHCLLVAGICAAFGRILGLKLSDRYYLLKAALLHDVGKLEIPTAILNNPGKLNQTDMSVMRTHTTLGYEMLLGCGYDLNLLAVVRSHHEMLDGSGYPDQLKGDEIQDLVRIVTICDIFSALIERRPYRAPMSISKAYNVLLEMGDKLDVDLVREFGRVLESDNNLKVEI